MTHFSHDFKFKFIGFNFNSSHLPCITSFAITIRGKMRLEDSSVDATYTWTCLGKLHIYCDFDRLQYKVLSRNGCVCQVAQADFSSNNLLEGRFANCCPSQEIVNSFDGLVAGWPFW